MGNPISPILADLHMSYFETHITEAFPHIFKTWYRYVDDVFAIVPDRFVTDALKLLNIQQSSIQFTMEIEKDNHLPFLDLKIIKENNQLTFGIYHKPTHTDNYIKNDSYNPIAHKHAVLNSLTHRLVFTPLKEEEYNKEYKYIISTAINNGFSQQLVDKKIKKYKQQKQITESTQLEQIKDKPNFRKFTYHPKLHHKFQKIFKKHKITLAPQNNFSLQKILCNNIKDSTPELQKSGVYKINCADCNKLYIGKTKRTLETRLKEHLRAVKYKQTEKSALAHHFWTTNHEIEKNISLVKPAKHAVELDIWEKIHIMKNKERILNFELPPQNTLWKFITPPAEKQPINKSPTDSRNTTGNEAPVGKC